MSQLDLPRDAVLFSGCTEQDLVHLTGIAQNREFNDGEILFSQGDEARDLMVLVSGKVRLELPVSILGKSRNIAFETTGPGDVVGWSALVPPYRFTLSARVSGEASIVAFPREKLGALCDTHPELGFRITKNLAAIVGRRLHTTQEMWSREVQRSLDERYR